MNYRTKLRQEYHKETGNYWKKINVNAEPTINYVKWLENKLKKVQTLPLANVSISLPDYEYEMLIADEGTPFEINSWIPIATDRIKDPSRIDEYITKGLIRKR